MLKLILIILLIIIVLYLYVKSNNDNRKVRFQDTKPLMISDNLSNPSVVKLNKNDRHRLDCHYLCMLEQRNKGWFKSNTTNIIAKLDKNYKVIHQCPISKFELPKGSDGLENMRIFYDGDRIGFVGISNDIDPSGKARQVVGYINTDTNEPEDIIALTGYKTDQHHRNWSINSTNPTEFIVSFSPIKVLKCKDDVLYEVHSGDEHKELSNVKSSTPMIKFGNNLLCVVNDGLYNRFIMLDKTYNVLKISEPFKLTTDGDTVTNIVDNGKEILISHGVKQAKVIKVPYHAIKGML